MPKLRHAVMKNVPIMHRNEEFVRGMVNHGKDIFVAMRVVPTKYGREEFAEDMAKVKTCSHQGCAN